MSDTSNPHSYPVMADSYLGTSTGAVILPGRKGELFAAVTLQALGAVCGETVEAVTLYVDTCPADGERGVMRLHLTVAEVKHLRRVLKNAITV